VSIPVSFERRPDETVSIPVSFERRPDETVSIPVSFVFFVRPVSLPLRSNFER
jgi:hypothetical protein